MGYLHIQNLYQNKDILLFKECYALEKIHGTSAHIKLSDGNLTFFSGGEPLEKFKNIFPNHNDLLLKIKQYGEDVIIYGEAYGGKQQRMSNTYGKDLKFIVFDIQINGIWLSVPDAEEITNNIGLEFVFYNKISTDLNALDNEMMSDSVQAIRNGMGPNHKREGIVIRPLIELIKSNGSRIISKHKNIEFRETATPRKVNEPGPVLLEANAIADEFVTTTRLEHVLDKIPNHNISMMKEIILAMQEDVIRESENEIIDSKEIRKAISQKTVILYKEFLKNNIHNV